YWDVGHGAQEDDFAREMCPAQRFCCSIPRRAAADNHESLLHSMVSFALWRGHIVLRQRHNNVAVLYAHGIMGKVVQRGWFQPRAAANVVAGVMPGTHHGVTAQDALV